MAQLWNAGNKYGHSNLKARVQTRPLGETPKTEKARPMEKPKKVVR